MKIPLLAPLRRLGRATWLSLRAAGSAVGRMVWSGEGGGGGGGRFWRALLPGSQYDYEAAAGDLWRSSTVAACLVWLKRNFPEPRLEQARTLPDGSTECVPKSRCVALLNRPNTFYSRSMLLSAMCVSAIVDGNVYLRKIRNGAGVPVELWWIPHWLVYPCWPADGTQFVSHYEYIVNGRTERIAPSEIVHVRIGVDPRNDRLGFADLKTAVRSICGLNECDTYTASIVRNMGVPGVMISPGSPDVSLDPDDIEIFKDQWRENYTSEGRGDPLVGTRMFTVEKISLTPEELRLDKLPQRLEDQICSVIGIPAQVVNLSSGAAAKTYANYGEARKAAYEDCLIPLQKMLAEELTIQLLQDFPDAEPEDVLRWDYSDVSGMVESQDAVADRVGKLYHEHQVITRAEAREALGYDAEEEDEVYFDQATPPPAPALPGPGMKPGLPPPDPDADGDPGPADDQVEPEPEPENENERTATGALIATVAEPSPLWRKIAGVLDRIEDELERRRERTGAARRNGDGDPWIDDALDPS